MGVRLLKNGETLVPNAGLAELRGVRSIVAGDYNNDGFPDLCVIADEGAVLYTNTRGTFVRAVTALPTGSFVTALFVDYDHDYDVDLILVGDVPRLLRNNGQAGFSDQTPDFPFASGHAIAATVFDCINDTSGHDVIVSYADHGGVLYRDLLAGKYRAEPVDALAAGARSIVAQDIDYDGWLDLVAAGPSGALVLLNKAGHFALGPQSPSPQLPDSVAVRSVALADFENRAVADLVVGGAVARNQGLGRFAAPQTTLLANAVAIVVADFDADGRDDAAAIGPDGALHLLHNDTATGQCVAAGDVDRRQESQAGSRSASRGEERHALPEEDLHRHTARHSVCATRKISTRYASRGRMA